MNKRGTPTDTDYENDWRMAEDAYRLAYADWVTALTSQMKQLPIPQIPDKKELAEVRAAMLRGDRVEQEILNRPVASAAILSQLAKACRDYLG